MRSRRPTTPDASLGTGAPFLQDERVDAELSIAENEQLRHRLRKLQGTTAGRERLRERTGIEHRLAHISQRHRRRARYTGIRKNEFDLRRAASIQNLETLHRRINPLRKAA